jgi:hypothetical protein
MTRKWRTRLAAGAAIATLLVLAGGWAFGWPMLQILTAYEAKMLCSEVLVRPGVDP